MTSLPSTTSVLRVRLGDAMLGIPALFVREVVRAVAITPVAGAPAIIEGTINVRGTVVPVADVRGRLNLAPRAPDPGEFMVLLRVAERLLALRVDDVDDLVEVDGASVASPEALSPALRGFAGLSAQADGVLVIHDPAAFVSQAERDALDAALRPEG